MELTISSPCPKTWEELVGDHRVRYCGQCNLNVYNLIAMTPAEVEQLVHRTGGRHCVQLYVRKDRTATLRDCPSGRSRVARRRIWTLAAALLAVILELACRRLDRPDLSGWPQWVQTVAEWMDPSVFRPRRIMGRMVCPPSTPAPSPVPPPSGGS